MLPCHVGDSLDCYLKEIANLPWRHLVPGTEPRPTTDELFPGDGTSLSLVTRYAPPKSVSISRILLSPLR